MLKDIALQVLPKNSTERIICIGFFLFYIAYSIWIMLESSLIDSPFKYDLIFSFDHAPIFRKGMEHWSSHPLFVFIMRPFVIIGNILSVIFGTDKAKVVFICSVCNFLVSLSVVYIYRYLREIVDLNLKKAIILTLFFGFFSTNLILSFTPETYTFSIFLLTFTLYYYSFYMKNNKDVPFLSSLFLAILLGGVTITNSAKGIIPLFFVSNNKRALLKKIVIISSILMVILIGLIFLRDIITEFSMRFTLFIGIGEKGNFWDNVISLFWGAPIFFPEITIQWLDFYEMQHWGITTLYYNHWWQYLFVGILTFFLIVSIIKNYKNKYVILVALLLSVDLFIHVVCRFGLADPIIYGGNWVYCVPVLLGWLFKTEKKPLSLLLTISFVFLLIGLMVNNLVNMDEFVKLAIEYFPVENAYKQTGIFIFE